MDFTLSKQHEMARQLFKDFAENEVKPLAQETDETEVFPQVTVDKMGKNGFLGIPVPKEFGGQGADILTYIMCVEELSKVCGTTGVIVSAHTSLCVDPILTYGTKEQKEKFLPPLCNGEKLGAFGLTEPGAGTDAQGAQTKAVLDGDEWVLNGSKCFITNGKVADVYIIIAVTDITEDKRGRKKKNFSAFIVEKGTPGFSFGTKEKKMGIRGSSTYELIFEDCRIPKENLLGVRGKGFPIAMHTLDGGRIGIASQLLVLLRVLWKRRSSTPRRESSSDVLFLLSRIHSSSLQIWLQRLRLLKLLYTRQLLRNRNLQMVQRFLTLLRQLWLSFMLLRLQWRLLPSVFSCLVVMDISESTM